MLREVARLLLPNGLKRGERSPGHANSEEAALRGRGEVFSPEITLLYVRL